MSACRLISKHSHRGQAAQSHRSWWWSLFTPFKYGLTISFKYGPIILFKDGLIIPFKYGSVLFRWGRTKYLVWPI
jgi:hypothetical protein